MNRNGPRCENARRAEVSSKCNTTGCSFVPGVDGAPAHVSSLPPPPLRDLSGENAVQSAWLWSQKKKKKTGRAQVGGSSTVLRHRYMHGHLFLFDRLVVLDCRRLLRVVPLLKTVNCAFVVSVLPVLHALRLHF